MSKSVPEYAGELAAAMETRTRGGVEVDEDRNGSHASEGVRFIALKEGSPDWMRDAVFAAHGDMLPDDWRYEAIQDAAEHISELSTMDYPEDEGEEWAYARVSVYTSNLLAWVGSNLSRVGYCDEGIATENGGLVSLMSAGQYMELRETYDLLVGALRYHADTMEEEEEDEDEEVPADA